MNVYAGSGNVANVTVYDGNGTALVATIVNEIDRWYTKAEGDMNTFNKEGALLIPPNQTMSILYTTDHTSGTIYARMSFVMED